MHTNDLSTSEVSILLIEDNDDDAELAITALRFKNLAHHLVRLSDGVQALEFLSARGMYSHRNPEQKPTVILLDIKMPKISGLEVLKTIKNDERLRLIPVVMLSSSQEKSDIDESYRRGANGYVVKPVEFEQYLEAITALGSFWLRVNHSAR